MRCRNSTQQKGQLALNANAAKLVAVNTHEFFTCRCVHGCVYLDKCVCVYLYTHLLQCDQMFFARFPCLMETMSTLYLQSFPCMTVQSDWSYFQQRFLPTRRATLPLIKSKKNKTNLNKSVCQKKFSHVNVSRTETLAAE